jgi:hypothetical protein
MKLTEFDNPKVSKRLFHTASPYFKQQYKTGEVYETSPAMVDMKQKLEKMGWRKISKGYFSMVFDNPKKEYILKVNMRPDSAYAHYVKIIHENPSVHFPKISDKKRLIIGYKSYYVYLIEKLQSVQENQLMIKIGNIIGRIAKDASSGIPRSVDDVKENCIKAAENMNGDLEYQALYYMANHESLIQASIIIGQRMGKNMLDIGSNNIMTRTDGTIVITDPYAFFEKI